MCIIITLTRKPKPDVSLLEVTGPPYTSRTGVCSGGLLSESVICLAIIMLSAPCSSDLPLFYHLVCILYERMQIRPLDGKGQSWLTCISPVARLDNQCSTKTLKTSDPECKPLTRCATMGNSLFLPVP